MSLLLGTLSLLSVAMLIRTGTCLSDVSAGTCGSAAPLPSPQVGQINVLGKEPWPTVDPFLFCAYHLDQYPPAQRGTLGPASSHFRGRQMGSDFSRRDGWSMYHGERVPGFPAHPHRGFETVTIVLKGLVDHFDSMGATGRYGFGDVQWLTTGDGVQHSEMFPLVNETTGNPLELFQLWLNLPRRSKKAKPYFSMFWAETIPVYHSPDFPAASVSVIAGTFRGLAALPPPPASWAADPNSDVAIWLVTLQATSGSSIELPPARLTRTRRILYVVRAPTTVNVDVAARSPDAQCGSNATSSVLSIQPWRSVEVDSTATLLLTTSRNNGQENGEVFVLVLQGLPIAEPVAQHGPFVLNTQQELDQTFADYRRTQFGGWPWPAADHHHPREQGRFAKRGRDDPEEVPPAKKA